MASNTLSVDPRIVSTLIPSQAGADLASAARDVLNRVAAHDALRLSAALTKRLLKPDSNPARQAYLARFVDFARQSRGLTLS